MTTYGLVPTGFLIKPADVIQAEIEAAQRAGIDPALDVSAESVVGQLNAPMVVKFSELWQLGQATYLSRDRSGATQAQLDAVSKITGTDRLAPTAGSVQLTLGVSAHTTIPAGTVFAVNGQPANRWASTAAAVNSTGSPAPVAGVPAVATQTGAIQALAGTITVIATPVSGLTSVTNPLDAVQGRDLETDAQLRIRGAAELEASASSPVDAIRAALLTPALADVVTAVFVEQNATSHLDAFGRPPHCIEAVVQFVAGLSGEDPGQPLYLARARVAAVLWASVAGGIDTFGDHATTVLDSLGTPRVVRWSEPALVPLYVFAELSITPAAYVGDAAVLDAILAFGAARTLGQAVVLAKLEAAIVNLAGVDDVLSLTLGTNAGLLNPENVGIDPRSVAVFDASRITLLDVS